MGMFKNMEVVLMLCFGLIVTAALLVQPAPQTEPEQARDAAPGQVPVVVVTGKRLSAAEKLQMSQNAG